MNEIAVKRRKSRQVQIGSLAMGGEAPVVIQSMINSKTTDVEGSLLQIGRLAEAGCQLVRLAIPGAGALPGFAEIKKRAPLPLVADIHFDYRLALGAMDAGADKIRINPGNIGTRDKVRQVVEKAIACRVPIRIGVNSGSVEKEILQQEGGPTVRALVRSALRHVELCREFGAEDLVLSLKSSDVLRTIAAYQLIASECDLPLHIGVTEAGTVKSGTIKSAVALGILLHQGIGDTLRVSLTGDVVEEVIAARHILKSLNLIEQGITLISCPTCGRTQVDLVTIAEKVEAGLAHISKPLTVAVMGCVVNGPGEAREADIGVACGRGSAVLIKRGQIIRKISEDEIVQTLIDEVNNWPAE
ncbi:MAG TPA: flavodoxin-dependent (E)-4-hydroxy-3-methylbut-2-enyl-diphosphate synthase [bacterium]|nr:flavodoxin-dependent (E)-4-hydroxy-3-methylbut-2-enyl-diphosphate synthase [bacterium]HOZ21507.1 flavodoxin-dependent (E)-4-hydroxy-3-methylbut-2-enyl-diphosphate synthase [bacterium]